MGWVLSLNALCELPYFTDEELVAQKMKQLTPHQKPEGTGLGFETGKAWPLI